MSRDHWRAEVAKNLRLQRTEGGTRLLNRISASRNTNFESLRRYVPGDDARSIDWRTSARRDDLVVRTYQQHGQSIAASFYIVIDTADLMQKPELIFNREDATDFRLSPLELNLPMIQATAKFLHSMQQEQSEVTIALFAWGTRILETSLSKPTSPKEINSQLIVDCMAATVRYADAFKRLCDAAQGTPDALKKYGVMNQDERELLRHRLAKDGVLLHLHGNRSATQQIDPLVQELAYGTRAARVNVEQ